LILANKKTRQGGGDGQGAEEHRPPGRDQRHPQRLGWGAALPELLPETRHQEQAVVDRQPQAEPDDQVEGEHRKRQHLVYQPEHQEGHQHAQPADGQREHRRHPPENEQGQEGEQGEGQQLGEAEVGDRLLAGLVPGHVGTAQDDVVARSKCRCDRLDNIVGARAAAQRGGHDR